MNKTKKKDILITLYKEFNETLLDIIDELQNTIAVERKGFGGTYTLTNKNKRDLKIIKKRIEKLEHEIYESI